MKEKKHRWSTLPRRFACVHPVFTVLYSYYGKRETDAPQYDYGTGSMPAMVVGGCMRRVKACGAESIGAQEESKYEWVDGGGARWTGEGRFPA